MKVGNYYRHKAWRDVMIEITHNYYVKEKDVYKIKGIYYLRLPNTKNKYECMNIVDRMTVEAGDRKNWKAIDPIFPSPEECKKW